MIPPVLRSCELLMLVCGGLILTGANPVPAQGSQVGRPDTRVSLPKGIPPKTTLKGALEVLQDKAQVRITVDTKAFLEEGTDAVEKKPVTLPKLENVRVALAAHLLARQVNGTCLASRNQLLLVPNEDKVIKAKAKAGFRRVPLSTNRDETQTRAKLNAVVTLEKAIDANTPLQDVLDFLGDKYNLTLFLDQAAFKTAGVKDVGASPVKLARQVRVPLATVLRMLLEQANATYVIHDSILLIEPRGRPGAGGA